MSTTDETYQGWTNRETWALMLHINNDQGLYESFRELVRQDATAEDDVRLEVESLLVPVEYRGVFGERQPETLANMASEVGSLWRVNWTEVVVSLLED